MEKRTKQLLIGGLIVIAIAGILFWFLRMRAYSSSSSFYCAEHPEKSICSGAPELNKQFLAQ